MADRNPPPPRPPTAPPPAPPLNANANNVANANASTSGSHAAVNKNGSNNDTVDDSITPPPHFSPASHSGKFSSEENPGERPRRSSFSFLRRSKSRESVARRSESDGKRKLARRSNKSQSKKEAAAARERAQQLPPPKLPSYHNLPRLNSPFDEGGSTTNTTTTTKNNSNTASTVNSTTNLNSFPPSAFSRSNPSRSGYNPNAFYQRYNNNNMEKPPGSAQDVPVPRVPESSTGSVMSDKPADPYGRTESMTNRGRYSYASTAISGNVNSPRRIRRRKDPTLLK